MTNGEKMQADFPDIERWGESKDTLDYSLGGMVHRVTKSWWNAEYIAPTTKNDLGVREFEEIVVEYPPEDLCTYPEYKGKPYFGIKYKENEKEIVGYGTYKPQVLSRYLKDYFMPTTKNDLPHCQYSDEEIAKSFIQDVEAVKDQLPCGERMGFPSTFDEFAKCYGFRDKEEIYTNGSELIPVFRVKQWLEHISTTKNDLAADCIDRAQAQTELEMNASRYTLAKERGGMGKVEWSDQLIKVSDAVDIIRNLPPVTPQEPKKGHWIYTSFDEKTGMKNVHICSNCGYPLASPYKSFCSVCGSDNREVEV